MLDKEQFDAGTRQIGKKSKKGGHLWRKEDIAITTKCNSP